MSEANEKRNDAPFYEVRQRYCPKLDSNVVMRRPIGEEGSFTCMSSHVCREECEGREKSEYTEKGLK